VHIQTMLPDWVRHLSVNHLQRSGADHSSYSRLEKGSKNRYQNPEREGVRLGSALSTLTDTRNSELRDLTEARERCRCRGHHCRWCPRSDRGCDHLRAACPSAHSRSMQPRIARRCPTSACPIGIVTAVPCSMAAPARRTLDSLPSQQSLQFRCSYRSELGSRGVHRALHR